MYIENVINQLTLNVLIDAFRLFAVSSSCLAYEVSSSIALNCSWVEADTSSLAAFAWKLRKYTLPKGCFPYFPFPTPAVISLTFYSSVKLLIFLNTEEVFPPQY